MIYFIEFLRDKKSNLLHQILAVLQFTLCFLIIILSTNQLSLTKSSREEFITQYLDKNYYQIVDNMYEEDENYQFEDVMRLKKMHNDISSHKDISYLELIYQPISLYSKDVKIEQMCDGYEDGNISVFEIEGNNYTNINSLRINENAINESDFKIQQGKIFNKEDYIYKKGKVIPVIIGSELGRYYSIGDRFNGLYLEPDVSFEIIGILEQDTKLIKGKSFVYVDYYFIIPSMDFLDYPESEFDADTQKIYYLQKINGIVKTDLDLKSFTELMNNFTSSNGFKKMNIISYEDSIIEIWGNMSVNSIKLLMLLSIITIIFSSVGLSVLLVNKFYKNVFNYGVYILCGGAHATIMKFFMTDVLFIISVSFLMAVVISQSFIDFNSMLIIAVLSCLSAFIAILGPYYTITKTDLNLLLRRYE